MKLAFPEAVLLDLDDTIIQFEVLKAECWNAVYSEFSARLATLGVANFVQSVLNASNDFWSDAERHRLWRQRLREARRLVVAQALGQYGVSDERLSDEIADRFSAVREEKLCLFPGAIETLERMRELGASLALVTNGSSDSQRGKIERFGLARLFDSVLIEGEMGYGKPDPRIYTDALKSLGHTAGEAWMIGDNQAWDVIPPQQLGMQSIWVNTKNEARMPESRPLMTLSTLSELLEHI